MCVASTPTMDSFLQTLLVERSFSFPAELNSPNRSNINSKSCIVVDDNARCHNERWSRLSRKVRSQMDPRSQRKKKTSSTSSRATVDRSFSNSSTGSAGSTSRWMSMEGSASIPRSGASGQPGGSFVSMGAVDAAAIPAPPQRQKSIEVNQQQLQRHIRGEHNSARAASILPRAPQRQQSIEIGTGSGHNPNNTVSTSSSYGRVKMPAVIPEEQLAGTPRMPERQASDQPCEEMGMYGGITLTPLPPTTSGGMSMATMLPHNLQRKEEDVQLAGQSFTKVIKRTRASLLDDDDDDDEDDAMELDHPRLMMPAKSFPKCAYSKAKISEHSKTL